jgi:hypothetical protein
MNNENNQEPQVTPVVENNNPQPQVNPNTIKSIDPELNDKVKTESGARIETSNVDKPQIHTVAFEKEHKKKELKQGTHDGPSGGLTFLLVLFFIFLIAFVFFLPDISEYMRVLKENGNLNEITSGKLICTNSRTSDKLNFDYTQTFEYSDKKLYKYIYKEEVRGENEDKSELTNLYNSCIKLEAVAGSIKGVNISCQSLANKFIRTETFSYSEIGEDSAKAKTAYVEGGGTYPEFKLDENIDDVEVSVKQAGYTCKKIK